MKLTNLVADKSKLKTADTYAPYRGIIIHKPYRSDDNDGVHIVNVADVDRNITKDELQDDFRNYISSHFPGNKKVQQMIVGRIYKESGLLNPVDDYDKWDLDFMTSFKLKDWFQYIGIRSLKYYYYHEELTLEQLVELTKKLSTK